MNLHPNPAVNRLLTHKAYIEGRIREELKRPLPDSITLRKLKRARLFLKDRITRLMKAQPKEVMPVPVRIS